MNLLVEESPGILFFDTLSTVPVPNSIAGYEYNLTTLSQFFYPLHPAG